MSETAREPVAEMVLRMRQQWGKRWAAQRNKWRALGKLRDGSYIQELRKIPWKVRYASNQASAIIEHQKALALQRLPVPRATTDERNTVSGVADAANAALDIMATEIDFERLCDSSQDTMHTYGPAIWKFLKPRDGKVMVKQVNLQNIFPHYMAETLSDCEGIIEDLILPLSEAKRRWPGKAQVLNEAAASGPGSFLSGAGDVVSKYNDSDYSRGASGDESHDTERDLNMPVLLHEWFAKDDTTVKTIEAEFSDTRVDEDGEPLPLPKSKTTKKYPKGRHVIITSLGDVVVDEANYDPQGKMPYVMAGSYWRPFKFFPHGDLEMMAPTILLYDSVVGAVATSAKNMASPSMAVDPRAGLNRSTTVIRPGMIWWVRNPGLNLMPVQYPPMHDSIYSLFPILRGHLQSIGNTTPEQTGQRPRGDISGSSMDKMAQAAAIRPSLKYANFEKAACELFQRLFKYAEKYWPDGKTLIVIPSPGDTSTRRAMYDGVEGGQSSWHTWDREEMKAANVRVSVEQGSGIPIEPQEEFMGILSIYQTLIQLGGGTPEAVANARRAIPPSYVVAHAPLRDKQMIMKRLYEIEEEEGRQRGAVEGAEAALDEAGIEGVQAMAYQKAAGTQGGGPPG